jgi:hypothetical protein
MPNRTPGTAKATRCPATEGGQQCLMAAGHPKMRNHTWGKRGETKEWHDDDTPKDSGQELAAEARRRVAEEQARMATEVTDQLQAVEAHGRCLHGYHDGDGQPMRCNKDLGHDGEHEMVAWYTPPDPAMAADLEAMEQHRAAEREQWGRVAEPQREEVRADAADQRRAEIAAAVTTDDRRDMERIRAERTDAILPVGGNGPRPVSVSGAPGSRLADVTSLVSTWTQLGFPVEVQDELTQIQIAKLALDSMLEEIIRTRRHSDPALVTSLWSAVDHIARARGLVRESGGGGS